MRLQNFGILALLAVATTAFWVAFNQPRDEAGWNGRITGISYSPYRAGQNNLASIVPPWAHEGGRKALISRLQDASLKPRLQTEILNGIPGSDWYNHYTATGSWEGMLLVSFSNPAYKKFEGKRMNQVIDELQLDGQFQEIWLHDLKEPRIPHQL